MTQGAIEPLIVRPLSESEYEVISGHRRMEICRELGIEKVPAIVRNLTDEQAVSMMVDAQPAPGKHIAQRACLCL